jgi:hypothetical protein
MFYGLHTKATSRSVLYLNTMKKWLIIRLVHSSNCENGSVCHKAKIFIACC